MSQETLLSQANCDSWSLDCNKDWLPGQPVPSQAAQFLEESHAWFSALLLLFWSLQMFEQRVLHFPFSLGPTIYVAGSILT